MRETDLLIEDEEPTTPFAFSLRRYQEQLVAGSHHTTPSGGLVVVMPDLERVAAAASRPPTDQP
jgi:hypothetical protein